MDRKFESILLALNTLKTASLQCPKTEYGVRELTIKYDILFLGEKFNTIYSSELCCALNDKFGIKIDLDELNQIIPKLCEILRMKCEPMKALNDISNPKPAEYQITLY